MNHTNQIILVTGATGNQGGVVAKSLFEQNKFKVRAMVRDKTSDKAKALQASGAELAEGDFDDAASLEKASQNVYGIFSMQDFRNGADKEIAHGKAIADAAKKTGVNHFVYSSVGGAERNTGIPHFESKYKVEEYIREIGLPYTILRPVFFMYNYNGMRQMIENGTLYMPLSSNKNLQQLSEDDYGKMVTDVFDDKNKYLGEEIEVASVDITMEEVVKSFSNILKKKVSYQQIPFEAFQKQAGEEVTTMFRWFENVGYNADIKLLQNTFFKLSSLEEYLIEHEWNKKVNVAQ
jgi:uncharacterized protein YbjT (DUF2867 family)